MGEVPLEWYRAEEHVGYDVDGRPLARRPRPDRCPLNQLLLCLPNGTYVCPLRTYGLEGGNVRMAALLFICENDL